MKITIESTSQLTEIEDVPVRVWEGVTDRGTRCKVFVHRLAVEDEGDAVEEFERELAECLPPALVVPLGAVL